MLVIVPSGPGADSGSISAGTTDLPGRDTMYRVVAFSLTNTSASNCGVTVYVSDDTTDIAITSLDFTIKPGQAYVRDSPTIIPANSFVRIIVTGGGTLDYYFSIM
jgi:hypothetical protein